MTVHQLHLDSGFYAHLNQNPTVRIPAHVDRERERERNRQKNYRERFPSLVSKFRIHKIPFFLTLRRLCYKNRIRFPKLWISIHTRRRLLAVHLKLVVCAGNFSKVDFHTLNVYREKFRVFSFGFG